jgi:hypothetical protein
MPEYALQLNDQEQAGSTVADVGCRPGASEELDARPPGVTMFAPLFRATGRRSPG